jgi:hypothetical protein
VAVINGSERYVRVGTGTSGLDSSTAYIMKLYSGIWWKFRIAEVASTFTAEEQAIGETLEIIEKIGSEQNCMIFSDLESVLKGIS